MDEFSKLARYAPGDVATDAAKQEKFLEGLNEELGVLLTIAHFENFQELVDKAIILEGKHHLDQKSLTLQLSRSLDALLTQGVLDSEIVSLEETTIQTIEVILSTKALDTITMTIGMAMELEKLEANIIST